MRVAEFPSPPTPGTDMAILWTESTQRTRRLPLCRLASAPRWPAMKQASRPCQTVTCHARAKTHFDFLALPPPKSDSDHAQRAAAQRLKPPHGGRQSRECPTLFANALLLQQDEREDESPDATEREPKPPPRPQALIGCKPPSCRRRPDRTKPSACSQQGLRGTRARTTAAWRLLLARLLVSEASWTPPAAQSPLLTQHNNLTTSDLLLSASADPNLRASICCRAEQLSVCWEGGSQNDTARYHLVHRLPGAGSPDAALWSLAAVAGDSDFLTSRAAYQPVDGAQQDRTDGNSPCALKPTVPPGQDVALPTLI